MHIDVFTLFPEMFAGPLTESILKRAREAGLLSIALHNIRDHTTDKHHVTDDTPYGGGGGMIMKVEPIVAAVESVLSGAPDTPVVLLTPQGDLLTQATAARLAELPRLALLCGHYEGVDERVRALVVTEEISVGDYVLTGGELPAMLLIDAVARLLPGALGDPTATEEDSHATGLLEYPHYTRPRDFRGLTVPDVLLSGDHARIARWRREQALRRTWQRRPALLLTADLDEEDRAFLAQLAEDAVSTEKASHDPRSSQ